MTTFNGQVAASADDAFEDSSGNTDINNVADLIDNEDELIGWRVAATIPQGATINSVDVEPYISSNTADEPDVEFWAEASDDAAAFTAGAGNNDISDRTPVSATPVEYDSADLGAPGGFLIVAPTGGGTFVEHVQEVIDRAGWVSGNHLAMICKGATGVLGTRDYGVNTYDASSAEACKITIDYTAAAPGPSYPHLRGARRTPNLTRHPQGYQFH